MRRQRKAEPIVLTEARTYDSDAEAIQAQNALAQCQIQTIVVLEGPETPTALHTIEDIVPHVDKILRWIGAGKFHEVRLLLVELRTAARVKSTIGFGAGAGAASINGIFGMRNRDD